MHELRTRVAHAQVAHEVAHTQLCACCTGVAHTICTRTTLHTHNSHTQCCTHTQFAHKHTRFTPPPSSRTLPAAVSHHRPHRNPPGPPNPCPLAPGSPGGGRSGSGAGPGAGTGGGAGRIGAERGRIGAAPLRQRGREPGGHGRAEQVRGHRAGGTGGGRGGLAVAPGLGWGSWGAPGGAQAWCCPGRASGGPPRAPRCLNGCREAGRGGALWAALGNIRLFGFLFCFFPLGIWVSGDVCPWEQLEKDQFQPPPRRGAFVNAVLSGSRAVPTLAAGVQSSQSSSPAPGAAAAFVSEARAHEGTKPQRGRVVEVPHHMHVGAAEGALRAAGLRAPALTTQCTICRSMLPHAALAAWLSACKLA